MKGIAGRRHRINRTIRLLARLLIMEVVNKRGRSKELYIQTFILKMLKAIRLQGPDLRKSRLRNLEQEWLIILTCTVKIKIWLLIGLKVQLDHLSRILRQSILE